MDADDGPPTGRTIKSVGVALTILETLNRKDGARLAEIAADVEVSKSTVHHYLTTLHQHEYVVKSAGKYHLGIRFLPLGGRAREKERLYQIGRPYVDRLASETGETVRLVAEAGGVGITLYQAIGENVTEPRTHVGSEESLHSTAAGKAFMAFLPSDRVEEILDRRGLQAYTEHTITDRDVLETELERIREAGVAYDEEEQAEGVRCVAAPVFSADRELLGAVSVSSPTERVDETSFGEAFPTAVRNAVEAIEIDTSYSTWD